MKTLRQILDTECDWMAEFDTETFIMFLKRTYFERNFVVVHNGNEFTCMQEFMEYVEETDKEDTDKGLELIVLYLEEKKRLENEFAIESKQLKQKG